ncbi:uncharacterized protein CcaverHIS019_0406190 [Cutaneotrichosporon cavernicola]|uniref:HIT domain-containing protein n=1 Tax=Cutaneotrichosporon cavernicola TaxID=279322 RepID=A0AA48QVX1_9TREE|nr:uncharacterized protein CcaverHIS019_0406190 [Cutaneotrichosporon cavernicola]BEI91799.1 hypothetical protein CcaverHIS019_0406190 [Cutaneotrichosporon cavernicola]BEI99571.1 hypothetical protein CcaverHIS631_0406140 [Cutaneotrichosporon cavernicola]BEJ07348.1 hypothetical protein CcaverHIS641_0406170 [Cutaneotrichosporon cavernicola]
MGLVALREIARLPRPSALPPSTLLLETPSTIAIFDKYPKAHYHVLVMPRLPHPDLKDSDLDSLASLLRSGKARNVLHELAEAAAEVEEMVRDEMVKTTGVAWGLNMGFHAVPSMHHLHLHVISDDLCSPTLKTKKHYNSFRPDLGFFVSLREVRSWLDSDWGDRAETLAAKEALLREPLTCFKCGEGVANIPALKEHLGEEFEREKTGR